MGDVVGAHKKSGYVQMARDLDSSPAGAHLPEIFNTPGTAQVRVFTAQRVSS